jgi:uncharacterized integral membrane protein
MNYQGSDRFGDNLHRLAEERLMKKFYQHSEPEYGFKGSPQEYSQPSSVPIEKTEEFYYRKHEYEWRESMNQKMNVIIAMIIILIILIVVILVSVIPVTIYSVARSKA